MYEKAAALGHAGAQMNAAVLLARGDGTYGTKPDRRRALGLLQQASANGCVEAMVYLGVQHCHRATMELPINPDPIYGACLLQAAAEKGNVEAQLQFAICHALGLGVPKNKALAREWLLDPALRGVARAQYNLGVLLDDGSLDASVGQAGDWLRAAAGQGHSNAVYNLGCMHARRSGGGAMRVAADHFRTAASLGHQAAAENLARLNARSRDSDSRNGDNLASAASNARA